MLNEVALNFSNTANMYALIIFSLGIFSVSCIEELTKENFDDAIKKHTNVLVDFWAPWCGACDIFKPKYDQVAAEFAGLLLFNQFHFNQQ